MKNKWRKGVSLVLLVMVMVMAFSVPAFASSDDDVKVLSFGHGQAETHVFHQTALKIKELLEEYSSGTMSLDIYANSTLGDERELAESLEMGTVDMCIAATAPLSGLSSILDVFSFPYLFQNTDQVYNVLMGDLGQEIFAPLEEEHGLKYFGPINLGFRSMTNNDHPIVTPEDCKGLRMRTLESNICVESLAKLGIDAVSMSFAELFTALQTGAVDAQENPISVTYSSRFYEVQKYLSLTEHFYPVCPVFISTITWDSLTEEQQSWVNDAVMEAIEWAWDESADQIEELLLGLEDNGMEINEVDKDAFIEVTKSIYDDYADEYGDLVSRIQAVSD